MEKFYTILTDLGRKKITNAYSKREPLELETMAVGDGGGAYYNPGAEMTALKNEIYRRGLNSVSADPDNVGYLVCEMVIPSDAGGFTVREAGIFDKDGDMIAVGKIPATFKPTLETGAAKDLYIRFVTEVSNAEAVTLKIDPSVVLATKEMAEKAASDAVTIHSGQLNPHNQYLMKKNYTAPDILEKLLTVDGAGSGLDADRLDGVELETINAAINSKQPAGDYATNTALRDGLAGKSDTGHAHKAEQVTFTDGRTFQQKLDDGSLRGQQGPQGPQGPAGAGGFIPTAATWGVLAQKQTGSTTCSDCGGAGRLTVCPECGEHLEFDMHEGWRCAICGWVSLDTDINAACPKCNGSGKVNSYYALIPAGGTWGYTGSKYGVDAGGARIPCGAGESIRCWRIA